MKGFCFVLLCFGLVWSCAQQANTLPMEILYELLSQQES